MTCSLWKPKNNFTLGDKSYWGKTRLAFGGQYSGLSRIHTSNLSLNTEERIRHVQWLPQVKIHSLFREPLDVDDVVCSRRFCPIQVHVELPSNKAVFPRSILRETSWKNDFLVMQTLMIIKKVSETRDEPQSFWVKGCRFAEALNCAATGSWFG